MAIGPFVSHLTPQKRGVLGTSGFSIITTKANGGEDVETLYQWDNFEVLFVYLLKSGDGEEKRYIYKLNGETHVGDTYSELRRTLSVMAFRGYRGKDTISTSLNEYLSTVPLTEMEDRCGFFAEGWVLPPKHLYFYADGIMTSRINRVKELMQIQYTDQEAVEGFQYLHQLINVNYKDIFLCLAIASPFFHIIREHLAIMPQVILHGGADRGKSEMNRIAVEVFWNQIVYSLDSVKSESRFMAAISNITFPITIDDCEKFPKTHTDSMKTHGTSPAKYLRKDRNNKVVIDMSSMSGLFLDINKDIAYLQDQAARTRVFYLNMDIVGNPVSNWREKVSRVRKGVIGRYIIEQTRDWTKDKIIDLLRELVIPESASFKHDNRYDGMVKCVMFGAYLIKRFFGLDMDITGCEDALKESRVAALGNLVNLIKEMARIGCGSYNPNPLPKQPPWTFRPTNWVKSQTIEKLYKDQHGILIDTTRKNELLYQYTDQESAKISSVKDLYLSIKDAWPEVSYANIRDNNGMIKLYLHIPSVYLVGENQNIYAYLEEHAVLADNTPYESNVVAEDFVLPPDLLFGMETITSTQPYHQKSLFE